MRNKHIIVAYLAVTRPATNRGQAREQNMAICRYQSDDNPKAKEKGKRNIWLTSFQKGSPEQPQTPKTFHFLKQ